MKRSQINKAYLDACDCFARHCWSLPPNPRWDITDFGLRDFENFGLVLINLAEEPEYCEKLMYARFGQKTPMHTHRVKKEDIAVRIGSLELTLWQDLPSECSKGAEFAIQINNSPMKVGNGISFILEAGERVTLTPGIYHAFMPASSECIIGEVSTANDDINDNFFLDPNIGRFSDIEEDQNALLRLLSE